VNQLSPRLREPLCTDEHSGHLMVADAARIIATWTDLAPGRAQKLRTALNTAARVLAPGLPLASALATVPMTWPSLSRLRAAPPATFGLTKGRMTSLCSELTAVLRRLHGTEPERRGEPLQSEALRGCINALSGYRKIALVRFLRFLDAEKIPPDAVDRDTFSAYQAHCAAFALKYQPANLAKGALRTWNWAHQNVPDWPGKPVSRVRTDSFTPRLTAYPQSFQDDVARYADRLRGRDLEHVFARDVADPDDAGRAKRHRPLRSTTIVLWLSMIRCAAGAFVRAGGEPACITGLRDLVAPLDHPELILRSYLAQHDGKPVHRTGDIARLLHQLARDHCRLPASDVAVLHDWARRVTPKPQKGMTDKNMRRLEGLRPPRVRAMLFHLPAELMKRAEAGMRGTASAKLRPEVAARLAMYAAAIEILLVCPLRCGNLVALRLDRHLRRPDPRKGRFTHIAIPGDEMKNDKALHRPIPTESQRIIQTYLTRFRPHLVSPENPYLFGNKDKPRLPGFFGISLSSIITRETGAEFNPHLARHFAARNFLRANPGQYEIVRQVLGHSSMKTTTNFYTGDEVEAAAEHFDRTVLQDRQALRLTAAQAFKHGAGGQASGRRPRK
jgi:integrase